MNCRIQSLLAAIALIFITACASDPNAPRSVSDKERVDALMDMAVAHVSENDPVGALQILAQVRDLNDALPEEYYLYALAYLQKNEIRLATESARHAVRLKPKYSAAKNTLGKLLLDQGKFAESEKYLLEAANDLLYREAYLAKTNLGILYFKRAEMPKSEMWLSRAIQDGGPLTCMASFYRGKIRLAENDLLSAERDFQQSSRQSCSGLSEAHIAIGQTLVRERKYDQARAKFLEIQRLFPSTAAYDKAAQYLREMP